VAFAHAIRDQLDVGDAPDLDLIALDEDRLRERAGRALGQPPAGAEKVGESVVRDPGRRRLHGTQVDESPGGLDPRHGTAVEVTVEAAETRVVDRAARALARDAPGRAGAAAQRRAHRETDVDVASPALLGA